MDLVQWVEKLGRFIPPWLAQPLERGLRRVPFVRRQMEREYTRLLEELRQALKPYHDMPVFTRLPETGWDRMTLLHLIQAMVGREEGRWQQGFVSGTVYHGGNELASLIHQVYALTSHTNPLHADLWPSVSKFEAEIVAMTAAMLGAEAAQTMDPDARVCGTVTSGGTESILLAMKVYRDWARATRGVTEPEIVLPVTAHPAFDKAAHYLGMRTVRYPVRDDYRADVDAAARAITKNTVVLVGSAPTFPHGVVDPIAELSTLAMEQGIGFHVDACLGGFVLPWAEKLGYPVPPYDFRLPGVTSISVDTHKYGYAAKGTSVVLYRSPDWRSYQYFTATDWPGGLYAAPTVAGSRPGALLAICWAVMISMGERGYLEATRRILETADFLREGICAIPELRVLGDPLWIIAFTSDEVNIYRVMGGMERRGWRLTGLQFPPAVHIAVTLRHTVPGVAERFLTDLEAAVRDARKLPASEGGMAPVYGMAASLPFRSMVDDLLRRYLDLLYEP